MPRYEYRCEANGKTVEVSHSMSDRLKTWDQVCEAAGIECGDTPGSTPVEKVLSLGFVKSASGDSGGCGPGCGCVGH